MSPLFERYLGIDYSGAKTPSSSLTGLRVYSATLSESPTEIHPPPSARKYWTRRGRFRTRVVDALSTLPRARELGIPSFFRNILDTFLERFSRVGGGVRTRLPSFVIGADVLGLHMIRHLFVAMRMSRTMGTANHHASDPDY